LAFKKSVGLNGNQKVNALSNYPRGICSDEKQKAAEFSAGNLVLEDIIDTTKKKRKK
jgi:topoisomerase-4 subunit B